MPKSEQRPKRKIAYVRWLDASFQEAVCTDDELTPGIILESAGIIAREDGDSISLAIDYCAQEKTWRRIQHIPKPYILEIKRVTV